MRCGTRDVIFGRNVSGCTERLFDIADQGSSSPELRFVPPMLGVGTKMRRAHIAPLRNVGLLCSERKRPASVG